MASEKINFFIFCWFFVGLFLFGIKLILILDLKYGANILIKNNILKNFNKF